MDRPGGPPSDVPPTLTRTAVDPTHDASGNLRLLVAGKTGMAEYDLVPDIEYSVGRTPDADIFIDSASVSRAHATIRRAGDVVLVRDGGSTNGTVVNGTRVAGEAVEVRSGDVLRFGDVLAQVRWLAPNPVERPKVLGADDFAHVVADEAKRCLRFGRSITLLSLEAEPRGARDNDTFAGRLCASLRGADVLVMRSATCADVLLVESPPEEGRAFGEHLVALLADGGWHIRGGIAHFPDGCPSADSVILSAQTALAGAAVGQLEQARAAARSFRVGGHEVVLADPAMVRLYGLIERVAASSVPLLVIGETGTGKEVVVETIHAHSRPGRPLVKINCAAMPEALLESELFGHERGAFSGATEARIGLFRAAHGGTIFLDEIGEMPPTLQAKVLRVLEDLKVRPIGGTTEHAVQARLVAATNRDLREDSEHGRFRRDLYFRLSGVTLRIPPLRERLREIPMLAERFAHEAAKERGVPAVAFSDEAVAALLRYAWPGNIRELRHAMSSAIMVGSGGRIEVDDLPQEVVASRAEQQRPPSTRAATAPPAEHRLDDELRALERQRIVEALDACGGNQTRAAARLEMPRRTLVAKLRRLGIRRD